MITGGVAVILVLISSGMHALYYLGGHSNMFGLLPYFNLDRERNIPTFYSVALLLFAALLLLIIRAMEAKARARGSRMWGILAGGFILLALDELVSIHEKLSVPVRTVLGIEKAGVFYYSWIVPGLVAILAVGFFFLRFWLRLPNRTRILFAVAGFLYVGGAIGMEMVGGSYVTIHGNATAAYAVIATVEETLELAGVVLFIRALLGYLAAMHCTISVRLTARESGYPDGRP